MNNKIIYNDNMSLMSFEALYCMGGYVTYEVAISTNGFSGICSFCIAEKMVQDYINRIDSLILSLMGEMKICDYDSDAYLRFFFEDTMNFYVSGQIGGSYGDNMLKFKLKADQTLLVALRDKLLDY